MDKQMKSIKAQVLKQGLTMIKAPSNHPKETNRKTRGKPSTTT